MSWFDGLIIVLVLAVTAYEMRQEAGLSLLDAAGTLLAIHFTDLYAPALSAALAWKVPQSLEWSPQAYLLLFVPVWLVALTLSRLAHRQTRWSMEQYDPVFGTALGLCVALALAHVASDVAYHSALLASSKMPGYFQHSLFAEELRSFRTYHRVLSVLMEARTAR